MWNVPPFSFHDKRTGAVSTCQCGVKDRKNENPRNHGGGEFVAAFAWCCIKEVPASRK